MKFLRIMPLALAASLVLVGLTAPAHAAQVRPLIQGVVVDQGGRYVDDVQVLAVRPDGTNAASALSYASAREDGPQHGYFFLAVGSRGSYEVVLSKPGYQTVSLGEYDVTRRGVVSLGEVEVPKKLVDSKTSCKLGDKVIGKSDRGSFSVTVTTTDTSRPTGEVKVYVDGKKVDDKSLRSHHRGAIDFTLPRLSVGNHQVKAGWGGTPYVKASGCAASTVTVKKAIDRRVSARISHKVWVAGSALLRLFP